jgi:two-component system chemotaxis response regulator CheB
VTVFRRLASERPPAVAPRRQPACARRVDCVVIGASTGGPVALVEILCALARPLPVPMLAVQHIAEGFLAGLARWLGDVCGYPVEIARDREKPLPGRLYLAPEGRHLGLDPGGRMLLIDAPARDGHLPSVDVLFETAAACFGAHCLAVLLTGMGRDGADGMGAVHRAGGLTLAQDQAGCAVFGMPAAAQAAGHAQQMIPLPEMAAAITTAVTGAPAAGADSEPIEPSEGQTP